jgi:hypothetical protein
MHGDKDGVISSHTYEINESALFALCHNSGAYLPLKKIIGKYDLITENSPPQSCTTPTQALTFKVGERVYAPNGTGTIVFITEYNLYLVKHDTWNAGHDGRTTGGYKGPSLGRSGWFYNEQEIRHFHSSTHSVTINGVRYVRSEE